MKKYNLLVFVFSCIATTLFAQMPVEKGLKSINRLSAEAYIQFLADDDCKDVRLDNMEQIWHHHILFLA